MHKSAPLYSILTSPALLLQVRETEPQPSRIKWASLYIKSVHTCQQELTRAGGKAAGLSQEASVILGISLQTHLPGFCGRAI